MTIVEVAKEAGVSIATISRVINGHGQIRPETRKNVLDAIRRTGYVIPDAEKRFRRGRKKGNRHPERIGLLVPDVSENAMHTVLTGRLLNGITIELQKHGIEVVFTKLTDPDFIPENITPEKVRGLIVKNWISNESLRDSLEGIPHVVCLETRIPEKSADQVLPETDQVASMALSHFRSLGAKRIIVLCDNSQFPQLHRSARLMAMAREVNIETRHLGCGESLGRLIELLKEGDGLFISANDSFTTQAYIRLHKARLEPGRDVHVVTIADDPNIAEVLDAKMATIDLQVEEIGAAAAQTLLWRIQNPAAPQRRIQISPVLKPRGII